VNLTCITIAYMILSDWINACRCS